MTKVERIRSSEASRFVTTPEWGRPVPRLEKPRLEARRKSQEEKAEEKLETPPTLPTGQPRMRGVNVLLAVLAVIGCIHIMAMVAVELNRMVASQREITRLSLETQVLEEEVAGLQSVLDNGNNPAFREQLARRAGFAYPDEVRYLSEPSAETAANQP